MEAQKRIYRLGILQYHPWLEVDKNGVETGATANMIKDIARSLNFTYKLVTSKSLGWGTRLPDGNWTGLFGMLRNDEADLIVIPLTASSQRMEVADFTFPYYTSNLMIMSGSNQEPPDNLFGYLNTFDIQVWLAILVSVLSMVTTTTLSDKLLGRTMKSTSSTWSEHMWGYLAAFFSEATPRDPKQGVPRFLLITWCISVLTLMNAFSGQFKSSLTVRKEADKIDSLEDLAKIKSQRILVWKGSYFEYLLRGSQQEAMKKVGEQVIKTKGFVTVKDMYTLKNYQDVVKGKTILLTEDSTLKFYLGIMCQGGKGGNVHLAKESVFSFEVFFAMGKKLKRSFKDAVDLRLYIYYESGLLWKWMNDMYQDYERCTGQADDQQEDRNLGLKDMIAIFLLWGVFLMISILVFLGELIISSCKTKEVKQHKMF